ncbi:hypothetical protein R1flu_025617 [Riccia fluitans]|uniref:Uncharacterized protein n=1 Tax=Riccia fluitans TaxID=41844 RepID=A0ABD1XY91_9MARC
MGLMFVYITQNKASTICSLLWLGRLCEVAASLNRFTSTVDIGLCRPHRTRNLEQTVGLDPWKFALRRIHTADGQEMGVRRRLRLRSYFIVFSALFDIYSSAEATRDISSGIKIRRLKIGFEIKNTERKYIIRSLIHCSSSPPIIFWNVHDQQY